MTPVSSATIRSALAYLFAALVVTFAARYVGLNWSAFAAAIAAIATWKLALAFALFVLHLAINAHAFAVLNRALDDSAPFRELRCAWMASLPAKYLPGGFGHVLGRGALLARLQVPVRVTVEAALWEQGLSVTYCALIAACLFTAGDSAPEWTWLLIALAATALAIAPAVARRASVVRPGATRALYRASALYGFSMLPYAAGYLALAYSNDWLSFLASLFAGTVAGVLAFPIPGGLGVRESAVLAMTESANASSILSGMIAGRVLILIAEMAASYLGLRSLRRLAR